MPSFSYLSHRKENGNLSFSFWQRKILQLYQERNIDNRAFAMRYENVAMLRRQDEKTQMPTKQSVLRCIMNNKMNFIVSMSERLCLWSSVIFLLISSSVLNAEEITYYHLDALGSTVAATDENGALLWKEAYRPYGERIRKEDGNTNDIWYTGKPHEEEMGLSYFGARWYDPNIGRFMAIDPVGVDEGNIHSFNRYAYANNNPYKYVDPDGRAAKFAGNPPIFSRLDGFRGGGGSSVGGVNGGTEKFKI